MSLKLSCLSVSVFVLLGCGGGEENNNAAISAGDQEVLSTSDLGIVTVYDERMLLACNFPGNITLEQSSESLSSSGVDVISSSCATLTNIIMTESCGDLSGEFYIHQIRAENLTDLTPSNFKTVSELSDHNFLERYIIGDGGVGYLQSSCR